jgi:hypothetical protein
VPEVVLGIVVIVDEVSSRGEVDTIRVHRVVAVDPRVDHADPDSVTVRSETGIGDLTLQGADERRAAVQKGLDRPIFFPPQHARRRPQRVQGLPGYPTQVDQFREDPVLVLDDSSLLRRELPHGAPGRPALDVHQDADALRLGTERGTRRGVHGQ